MKWLSPSKTAAFAACLSAFLIGVTWIFYSQLLEEIDWSRRTTQTYQVLTLLESIRSAEKVLDIDQKEYLLTGEERLLSLHKRARQHLKDCLSKIEELIKGSKDEQSTALAHLREEIKERCDLADLAIAEMESKSVTAGLDMHRSPALSPNIVSGSNELSQEVDTSIDQLEDHESQLCRLHEYSFERASRHAVALLGLLAVAIAFLALAFLQRHKRELRAAERAETALQEKEGRLRAIFENMGEGLYQLDQSGRLIYLNPAGAHMLGYDPSEILGSNMVELVHPAKEEDVSRRSTEERELLAVIKGGVNYHSDNDVYVRKGGSLLPVRVNGAPLFVDGRVSGAVVTFEDISDLKEAEKRSNTHLAATRAFAQLESIEQAASKVLEAICQNLSWDIGAYWIRSESGEKLDLLQIWHQPTIDFGEFEELYRTQVDDQKLHSHYNAFFENAPLWLDARNQDAVESFPPAARACGLKTVLAFPLRNEDECIGVIELFGSQPREPEIELLRMLDALGRQFGQYIERRRVDKKLKDSEEIFKQLANNVHEVFWIANPDLRKCLYVSPAFETDWGFSCEEALRDAHGFLNTIAPEDRHKLVQQVAPEGFSEEGREIEYRVRRRDGKERWIWSRVCPILDEKGNIVRICGISHDITERKEVERRVSEFYSTVSHELRTPLTSIRAALGILEGGLAGELSEKAAQLIRIGRVESDRLIRLINDILDIRKIESGKLELKMEAIDLSDLVKCSLDAVHAMANEAKVQLRSEINANRRITCDQDRVVQVLTNLLSNAVKFSPPHGEVLVTVVQDQASTRFSIQDQGPGIPEHELHKLFGKFQQLDSSDSRKKGGTGLGLAITKAIVEEHRGKIAVNTRYGEGSTFWFELPNNAHIKLPSLPQRAGVAPHTVLIIEDDLQLAELLKELLSKDGFSVSIASTLKVATDMIDKSIPHVVVLDVLLPDGNGLEWMQTFRETPVGKDIPIIVLTGHEAEMNKYGHPRLIDWLKKPFDEGHLVRALKLAVQTQRKNAAKVLVVDDDLATREVIIHQLKQLSVNCLEAKDGAEAISLVRTEDPDLIVLDIGLPNPDGFGVVQILRQEQARSTPLIVYTSREIGALEREELTLGLTRHLVKSRTSEGQFISAVRELLAGLVSQELARANK
jgi:PAS domain S-box-containing protein